MKRIRCIAVLLCLAAPCSIFGQEAAVGESTRQQAAAASDTSDPDMSGKAAQQNVGGSGAGPSQSSGVSAKLPASLTDGLLPLPFLEPYGVQRIKVAVPYNEPYVPLSVREQYRFATMKMTGAGAWSSLFGHTALEQAGLIKNPWGSGIDAMAISTASQFGRSFVYQNVAFGIRALDHEDPRYFRLGEGGGWTRAKWALLQTVVARNDKGRWMPAYSRFAADFSAPLVSGAWMPGPYSASHELRSGAYSVGLNALSNLFQEFLPDLKRKLRGTPQDGGHFARWREKIHD
jgi:hypothetical protein